MASRCSFCLKVTLAMPSMVRSLSAGNLHRSWRGRGARRRLRKRGRAGGVEGDVAFHFLHDLVDMAVEHGHRAEALEIRQRLGPVVGAPAPIRIDGPQRNVGEHDDRRRRGAALQVVFEPFELLGAEIAQAAGLEIDDVDEADEMHAVGVEPVPAGAFGAASVAIDVELLVRVEEVVLAGNVMHVEPRLRDDLIGVVKLRFQRQMADVAGMNHEGRLLRQCSALTLAMASSSVPSAFGLGGRSKPIWLSLICRKVRPLRFCARPPRP